MPFQSKKAKPQLSETDCELLQRISNARGRIPSLERARILLHFKEGLSNPKIAAALGTTVPKVIRCVDKALANGVVTALEEEQHSGRSPEVTPEAMARVLSLACPFFTSSALFRQKRPDAAATSLTILHYKSI